MAARPAGGALIACLQWLRRRAAERYVPVAMGEASRYQGGGATPSGNQR